MSRQILYSTSWLSDKTRCKCCIWKNIFYDIIFKSHILLQWNFSSRIKKCFFTKRLVYIIYVNVYTYHLNKKKKVEYRHSKVTFCSVFFFHYFSILEVKISYKIILFNNHKLEIFSKLVYLCKYCQFLNRYTHCFIKYIFNFMTNKMYLRRIGCISKMFKIYYFHKKKKNFKLCGFNFTKLITKHLIMLYKCI